VRIRAGEQARRKQLSIKGIMAKALLTRLLPQNANETEKTCTDDE